LLGLGVRAPKTEGGFSVSLSGTLPADHVRAPISFAWRLVDRTSFEAHVTDRPDVSLLRSADFETWAFQDGLHAPPGVCGSFAGDEEGSRLYAFPEALDAFEALLRSRNTLAGANIVYDCAVACAEPEGGRWKGRPELLPLVFDKFERGEVWDVLIAQALDAVAAGHLFKDPRTGGQLRKLKPDGSFGKVTKRYSLELVTYLVLGRKDAKANDEYKKRYAELENLPLDAWPEVARIYPLNDADNTLDSAIEQVTKCRNVGKLQRQPWSHMTHQARAAWAMQLLSVWGLRTDAERVEELSAKIEADYAEKIDEFKASKIIRSAGDKGGKPGSKNTGVLKRLTVKAYGSDKPCAACAGSGRMPSPANPRNKINCKACRGAGLEFPPSLPLTDGGDCSTSRDTLEESGDDLLERFAHVSETVKLRGTYLPLLRVGTDKPINVPGNVLVESGRASFEGLVQLLPRNGGIREAFVPRRREFVKNLPADWIDRLYCSVDYSALELCTLSQVCLWVVGWSAMADAINKAKDPGILHTLFGAKLINANAEEFVRKVKAGDKDAKNARQAAKAANFGFPGLMGPAKLTIAKRKEGLRFCIVAGRAPPCEVCHGETGQKCRRCYGRGYLCGLEKVTEWNRRPIPPTCPTCIVYATELRAAWLEQWPEIREYFEWVKSHPGIEDGLGAIVSPGTGYERGGLYAAALANHSFQSLAGFGAKHALWLVSRECYVDRSSPLYGSRPVVFAHDEVITEIPRTSRTRPPIGKPRSRSPRCASSCPTCMSPPSPP
jgi:hypothetical protein